MSIELKRAGLQRVTAALGAVLVAAILTGCSKKAEAPQAVAISALGHLILTALDAIADDTLLSGPNLEGKRVEGTLTGTT